MDISSVNNLASSAAAVPTQTSGQPVSQDERAAIQAVKSMDTTELFGLDKELTFVRDFYTQKTVARIIDKSTGDIVAQIPPEDILRMAEEVNGC